MEIKKYMSTPVKTIGENNEECCLVEINSPKQIFKNNFKHASHFRIIYKTQEELDSVLSEFTIVEEV